MAGLLPAPSAIAACGALGNGVVALARFDAAGKASIYTEAIDAATATVEGAIGYDTGSNLLKVCDGSAWQSVSVPVAGVPAGAVMAFDLTSCPAGWSEYTQARGRFLRGIDPSGGTAVDPAGLRAPGSQQEGSLIMQNGGAATDMRILSLRSLKLAGMNYDKGTGTSAGLSGSWLQTDSVASGDWGANAYDGNYVGIARPRNVAVLFCRKS